MPRTLLGLFLVGFFSLGRERGEGQIGKIPEEIGEIPKERTTRTIKEGQAHWQIGKPPPPPSAALERCLKQFAAFPSFQNRSILGTLRFGQFLSSPS